MTLTKFFTLGSSSYLPLSQTQTQTQTQAQAQAHTVDSSLYDVSWTTHSLRIHKIKTLAGDLRFYGKHNINPTPLTSFSYIHSPIHSIQWYFSFSLFSTPPTYLFQFSIFVYTRFMGMCVYIYIYPSLLLDMLLLVYHCILYFPICSPIFFILFIYSASLFITNYYPFLVLPMFFLDFFSFFFFTLSISFHYLWSNGYCGYVSSVY